MVEKPPIKLWSLPIAFTIGTRRTFYITPTVLSVCAITLHQTDHSRCLTDRRGIHWYLHAFVVCDLIGASSAIQWPSAINSTPTRTGHVHTYAQPHTVLCVSDTSNAGSPPQLTYRKCKHFCIATLCYVLWAPLH